MDRVQRPKVRRLQKRGGQEDSIGVGDEVHARENATRGGFQPSIRTSDATDQLDDGSSARHTSGQLIERESERCALRLLDYQLDERGRVEVAELRSGPHEGRRGSRPSWGRRPEPAEEGRAGRSSHHRAEARASVVAVEAVEPEQPDVVRGRAVAREVGQDLAHDRTELEAVAGEARRDDGPLAGRMEVDQEVLVG